IGSGGIHAAGRITFAAIGRNPARGAVLSDKLKGGIGGDSGTIIGDTGISSVIIRGHVTGGAGDASGSIQANGFIRAVTILGGLNGASGNGSGAIAVHDLDGPTLPTPG